MHRPYLPPADNFTQVDDRCVTELAFREVQSLVCVPQSHKNLSKLGHMFTPRRRINYNVIEVSLTAWYPSQNVAHQMLKGCRGVPHSKRHDVVLEENVGVTNAETSFARSVSGTCQYPFKRLSFVTYSAVPTRSTKSSIRGRGKQSGLVTLLTLR